MTKDLSRIIASLEERFMPECTEGWLSTIHVVFEGGGEWTLDVENCALRVAQGLRGEALSTVRAQPDTFDAVFSGRLPLEIALMSGRLSTDNLVEIFKLQTVFKKVPDEAE